MGELMCSIPFKKKQKKRRRPLHLVWKVCTVTTPVAHAARRISEDYFGESRHSAQRMLPWKRCVCTTSRVNDEQQHSERLMRGGTSFRPAACSSSCAHAASLSCFGAAFQRLTAFGNSLAAAPSESIIFTSLACGAGSPLPPAPPKGTHPRQHDLGFVVYCPQQQYSSSACKKILLLQQQKLCRQKSARL